MHALATAEANVTSARQTCLIVDDGKDAFGQISRNRLLDVLKLTLPGNVTELIELVMTTDSRRGVRQGSPLSPLLLNVCLDHFLDKPWKRRHPDEPLIRSADDILICCGSVGEAGRAYQDLKKMMTAAGMPLKGDEASAIQDLSRDRAPISWVIGLATRQMTLYVGSLIEHGKRYLSAWSMPIASHTHPWWPTRSSMAGSTNWGRASDMSTSTTSSVSYAASPPIWRSTRYQPIENYDCAGEQRLIAGSRFENKLGRQRIAVHSFNAGMRTVFRMEARMPAPKKQVKKRKINIFKQLTGNEIIGVRPAVSTEWSSIDLLHGIVLSLYLADYRERSILGRLSRNVPDFYQEVVEPCLCRDATLKKAEVRDNGEGVDVILKFDSPVTLQTSDDRDGWKALTQVVQSSLPVRLNRPSLAPLVRALGSINGSASRVVTRLAVGEPVSQDEVCALYADMRDRSFRTVMHILAGQTHLTPCPVCKAKGSSLVAEDDQGICDRKCGAVSLGRFYDLIFVPTTA